MYNSYLRLEKQMWAGFLLMFALLVLSDFQLASSYGWRSNWELWDLEYNNASFIDEVSAWSATLLLKPGVKHSVCSSAYIMGGYGVLGGSKNQYFERTFTNLPPHNQLNLTYLVYPIDSWDGGNVDDHYEVGVDDFIQRGWRFTGASTNDPAACGSGKWYDYPPVLAVSTFVHSGSSVRIRFINMLNQGSTDESLGIRDVKLKFVNVTNPQNSLCGRSTVNKPLPEWPCKECDSSHQYMTTPSSGTCYECADSCATCKGAGDNGCLSCADGRYIEGSSCKQCSSNCVTCMNNANYCLSCISEEFLVSNVCYPTCTFPLSVVQSGLSLSCSSPCQGGEYAMWDGSCSKSCLSELTPTTMCGFPVCTFPCSTKPTAF